MNLVYTGKKSGNGRSGNLLIIRIVDRETLCFYRLSLTRGSNYMASAGKVLVFGIDARLQNVVAHGTFDF